MKKNMFIIVFVAALISLSTFSSAVASTVYVSELKTDWTTGVYSLYNGPPDGWVSPGTTAVYEGREAGIIKAGFVTIAPWDDGLFAFIPNVTIDVLAAGTLSYDVVNQYGENPVWMTIEIDTGIVDSRADNTVYQHVPTTNPPVWHTVDAGTGLWQKWNNNMGDTTGNPKIELSAVVAANTGLNVVRTYLRLGMGLSYHGTAGLGTVGWVDKATIGGVTYDFIVMKYYSSPGFLPPISSGAIKVKKNRVIPLKAELFDAGGAPITNANISAAPVIQVWYQLGSSDAQDMTDAALAAGQGTEGNKFVFSDGLWQFNLQTKNYTSKGTYTVQMVPGGPDYTIDPPAPTATFVIE